MTLKYAMRGDNAVVERASVSVGEDYADLAVNSRRQATRLWTSPVTTSRLQDAANADYYPMDTCRTHGVIVCSLGATSHSAHPAIYKTNGLADENGDYTFTLVATATEAPFSGITFHSIKCLDNGTWILCCDSTLWKSTDAGATWSEIADVTVNAWPFSWSGVDGAHIVVAPYLEYPQTFYVSHDYGETWEAVFSEDDAAEYLSLSNVAGNSHIHTCVWDPTSDHTAFFASRGDGANINALVYRVYQSGESWLVDTDWYFYDAGIAIAGITLTSGQVVQITTAVKHSFITGDTVRFWDVGGTVELNSGATAQTQYTVTRVNTTAFTLNETDGDNFTAWTSGGVVRRQPVGPGQRVGRGMCCSAISFGGAVYFATEASKGVNVLKADCATRELTTSLRIPRLGANSYTMSGVTGNVHFEFRRINGVAYLPAISDGTHNWGSLYVSNDMVHWALVKRHATDSGSFWGVNHVAGLNGKLYLGCSSADATRWGEVCDVPQARVQPGLTVQNASTNLFSPSTGHDNDDANFSTAAHGWAGGGGFATVALSTEQALRGTKSLKLTGLANGDTEGLAYAPYVRSVLGYTPQVGDYIAFRARVLVPEAWRTNNGFSVRLYGYFAGGGAAKTTMFNESATDIRGTDGWHTLHTHAKINTTYDGTDDIRVAVLVAPVPPGVTIYVDCAEAIVRTTRLAFIEPYNEGAVAAEYGLFPMAGVGKAWTATMHWRPEYGAGKQIVSGSVPVCRTLMADGSYVDLTWIGDAGADRGKFQVQRTLLGAAQTAVLSTSTYEPFFDDVVHVAVGTDNANSKIYASLVTPTGVIEIEDANTGCTQPTHMLVGTIQATGGGGLGIFNAVQLHDTEFVTNDAALADAWRNLYPRIRKMPSPPGLLLPR